MGWVGVNLCLAILEKKKKKMFFHTHDAPLYKTFNSNKPET